MRRLAIILGCLALAAFYGFELGVAAAVPGVVLAYLFASARPRPPKCPVSCSTLDPRAIKQYRVAHPGVGIEEAAEALS